MVMGPMDWRPVVAPRVASPFSRSHVFGGVRLAGRRPVGGADRTIRRAWGPRHSVTPALVPPRYRQMPIGPQRLEVSTIIGGREGSLHSTQRFGTNVDQMGLKLPPWLLRSSAAAARF